jgi:hypothetical protein
MEDYEAEADLERKCKVCQYTWFPEAGISHIKKYPESGKKETFWQASS